MGRAKAEWEALSAEVEALNAPRLPAPRVVYDRSAIVLGRNAQNVPVILPEITRLQHAHVIGSIGSGKSTFLEHCIRQDIIKGRGVCVIDPHGNHPDSLYRKLLCWLDAQGYTKGGKHERTIHLLDPNAPAHTVGFNPLARPTPATRPEVLATVVLEAFERVWGDEDTHAKPTIRRVLKGTFTALAELGLTLAEADLLYDPFDAHGVRQLVLSKIKDRYARNVIGELHQLGDIDRTKQSFRAEVIGPMNRLAEFVSNEAIRTIIGQTKRILDIRAVLDEGHIILANLGAGDYVEAADAELLGRLLTRMFFFHAKNRTRKPIRPYWLYLDECQLYLSGDIQKMLAECRKYGLGVVLSHQYLRQLGEPEEELRAAVRNSTKLKAVFNVADHIDAEELAQAVMTLNLEQPVQASVRPTVVGHRVTKLGTESVSEQESTTDMRSFTKGESESETRSYAEGVSEMVAEGTSSLESEAMSVGEGTSQAFLSGTGSGISTTEMMTPATGWLAPAVVGMSEGASSMAHDSRSSGMSSMTGRIRGTARGRSYVHATGVSQAWGQAVARGVHTAETVGAGKTFGTANTRGASEAFEPVYALLPTSFHSKENALYMASQMLRALKIGTAYVRYFDAGGARETFLAVPRVIEHALPDDGFAALRDRVLSESPSACKMETARHEVAAREDALMREGIVARTPSEPKTSGGFRIKKKRPAKPREKS